MKVRLWVDGIRRDLAYATRSLARSRGFTAAAALTLAIGIGATTAICSIVYTVLLQPLQLTDAHRLVLIAEHERPRGVPPLSYREYQEWQARTMTLSGLAASTFDPQAVMAGPTGLVRVTGGFVSPNYFEVLGARPLLGRALASSDAANPDVMVVGYYCWQRSFASDPKVVGTSVVLRSGALAGRSLTVIGVMPESMETIGAPRDFYVPLVSASAGRIAVAALVGRLREGVSLAAASSEADAIGTAIRPPRPAAATPLTTARFDARLLEDTVFDPQPGAQGAGDPASVRTVLRIFLAATLVVLLIVCANVANLLLARGTARRRDLATRLALGASRSQLIRHVLAECSVLAAAGGTIGAALGATGILLVKQLTTVDAQGVFRIVFGANILPRSNEIAVDGRVLGMALAVAAIAMFAFGLFPALHLSRTNHLEALGSRGTRTTRRDTRMRTALVIGELAMATVLLVGAALLAASFVNLARVEKGYDPRNVLAFQLVLPGEYPTARKAESIEGVLRGVRAIPNVSDAGFAYAGIMIGIQDMVGSFVPPNRTLDDVSHEPDQPRIKSISPGYLEAAGVTLLDGRLIAESDATQALPVVVINRIVQRRYFREASPIGAVMQWHGLGGPPVPVQIVGVVADVRQGSLAREPYPEIFMDYRQVIVVQERWGLPKGRVDQLGFGFMSFAVRTAGNPTVIVPQVRRVIAHVDSNAALDAIMPMDNLVASSVARQRFYAAMLTVFASVAALLAAIGIYGVLAYSIVEQTREIGVRMALGAQRYQVLGLVLGRGLRASAIGIALGMAAAAAATRYLRAMLYGITPLDGHAFVIVASGFAVVAAVASYLPAKRATAIDPMEALRME